MKIIGLNSHGYICEVSKNEMKAMTNIDEPYSVHNHSQNIGAEINVLPLNQHIRNMDRTIEQRKNASDLLRSAATIIESIPDTFKAPEPASEPLGGMATES